MRVTCVTLLLSVLSLTMGSTGYASDRPHCGLYAVHAASVLLGREIELPNLVKTKYVGCPNGSTFAELIAAAEDHGLHAEAVSNIDIRWLDRVNVPTVLYVRSSVYAPKPDHYVLTWRSNGTRWVYSMGEPVSELDRCWLATVWNGEAITVSESSVGRTLGVGRLLGATLAWLPMMVGVLVVGRSVDRRWFTSGSSHREQFAVGAAIVGVLGAVGVISAAGLPNGLLTSERCSREIERAHATRIAEIGIAEMKRRVEQGALLVDARLEADFARGTIPNAVNLPVFMSQDRLLDAVESWDRDATIITFCQSRDCTYAVGVGRRLKQIGFRNVVAYEGGWVEWSGRSHQR